MKTRDDRGSMSVFVVAILSIVMLIGVVGLGLGQWAVAAARLSSAADLAALAAADAVVDPCGQAERVARANDTMLIGCTREGDDVVATVQSATPPFAQRIAALLGRTASALQRSARAGQQDVEQADGT